jgi:DNA (cytosine-5)-methyltransferase 1
LFKRYPNEAAAAREEAWNLELCKENAKEIHARIVKALDGKTNWVLLGGPPCQAYSIIGRNRMRGKDPKKFEKDHRHHLYREYLQILIDHKPSAFVLENVLGLLSSSVKGESTFPRILQDLSMRDLADHSYSLYPLVKQKSPKSAADSDYLLYCENYGIPQSRHRIIILGLRKDLGIELDYLERREEQIYMWDAICDMPRIRSGLSRIPDSNASWSRLLSSFASVSENNNSMPSDILIAMKKAIDLRGNLDLGGEFVAAKYAEGKSEWLKKHAWWFADEKLQGVCNHSAKKHMEEDLYRYQFAACYAKVKGKSPTVGDFPPHLRPAHKNVQEAVEGRMFSDRFRVQLKNYPSTTIVAHISKDGHYYIHPDPVQCRSLTVREAARLQTFPDNYFFEGSRTSQYTQVGNAVPPLLALQVAEVVKGVFRKGGVLNAMDRISEQRRSWNMSRIKSKNTLPEKGVRSIIHALGYRFRLYFPKLPGKPDITLPRLKTVVFVHGCYWHRHPGCKLTYTPKTHREFWEKKFKNNVIRDKHVENEIKNLGWLILTVWECELADREKLTRRLTRELALREQTMAE